MFKLNNLFKKTPEAAKSVSDAIAWSFGAGGVFMALILPYPKIGATIAVIGCVAKAAASFYGEDHP